MSRPLRVLVAHPGADWSTSDVYDGLTHGLRHHGVEVIPFRLDNRLEWSHDWLNIIRRKKNRDLKAIGAELLERPTHIDIVRHASLGLVDMAWRHRPDAVIVVSAMFLHPDALHQVKEMGQKLLVLFTESPYDIEKEIPIAAMADGCWTNERTSVAEFRKVNPRSGYLPHGWHPEKHRPSGPVPDVPAHDVVFVGSGFQERIDWFNAIDWTGIDLGLYGTWKGFGLSKALQACIRDGNVSNTHAAALYRNAKIGINLYRNRNHARRPVTGESLSPRAYELARCGAFHISDYRPEVAEVFGDRVPTFTMPQQAAALIRRWLPDDAGRAAISADLPACVAESSWLERASRVIGDLQVLLDLKAA
jgi:hypothetical protein